MNEVVTKFAPLVGRIMITLIFLLSGYGKIVGFDGNLGYMESKGVPMKEVLLVLSIVIELAASVMIIVGWKAWLGAAALFVWMIPVTLMMHNFWALEGMDAVINRIMFLKNVSLMGAMLYIVAFGSGKFSLEKQ